MKKDKNYSTAFITKVSNITNKIFGITGEDEQNRAVIVLAIDKKKSLNVVNIRDLGERSNLILLLSEYLKIEGVADMVSEAISLAISDTENEKNQ